MRCFWAPFSAAELIQVPVDFVMLFLCFIYNHMNINDIYEPLICLSEARTSDPMPFAQGAGRRAWPGAALARSPSEAASADNVSCHYFNSPLT